MFVSTVDECEQMNPLNNQGIHYCPTGLEDYKLGDVGGDRCTLCTELKLLELLKEDLIRRTAQLRVKINQSHSAINRQLPPEILATIFQAYVDDPSYDDPFYEIEPLHYPPRNCNPLLLGAVCRTWRDIAWSMQRLWASITINLDFPYQGQTMQMSLTQEWLSRAGQLPLSIRLVNNSTLHNDDVNQTRPIIDLVNRYSPRWRNLIIHLPTYMFPWFATVGNHAPLLEYLKIEGKHHFRNNDSRYGDANLDTLNLGKTPSLNYLSTQRLSLCQLELDWNSLTHLSAETLTDIEGLEVLRRAPLLEHIDLQTTTASRSITSRYAPPTTPIVAQHLRTLSLTFQNHNGAAFMDNVTCPALDTFSVVGPPMGSLPSFSLRSGFTLKCLSLKFCRDHTSSLEQLLYGQPSLVELNVGWSPHLDVLLAELTATAKGAEKRLFLPNLETLEYVGAPENLNWEQFGDLFPSFPILPNTLTEDEAEKWSSAAIGHAFEARLQPLCSRPWRRITMTLLQDGDQGSTDGRGVPYISEPVIARLHDAMVSGIEVEIKVPAYSHSDALEMRDWVIDSEEWHEVERENATEMSVGS